MENKEVKISFWASHLTTIVSVTLVLLLVGIIAMVWVGANNETRRLREQVELCAVLSDSVSNARANNIGMLISKEPYSKKVVVVSKEQALKNWTADTGEDLAELYGLTRLVLKCHSRSRQTGTHRIVSKLSRRVWLPSRESRVLTLPSRKWWKQ